MSYVLIFILTLFFIKILKYFAPLLGFIDIPNGRSTHTSHTPRGAGIGFFMAIALVLPIFYPEVIFSHVWTIFAIFCVFFIGVLDDHHDASANTKFSILILATFLLSMDGIIIKDLGVFFGMEISLAWFALPFTIFAVVGFTNALNLIDGLDGLSATLSIIILTTFFIIGNTHHDLFIMSISGAFVVGLLAFLIFNWHPASIFMGDSGSLTLGFVISVLAVKSLDYVSPVSIIFITAIPIMDTIIVMTRRKRNGKSMFSADRCHVHHILRHFFAENTPRTVVALGILQAIYSMTGLQLVKVIDTGYIFIVFILNMALLYMFLGAMIRRQKRDC